MGKRKTLNQYLIYVRCSAASEKLMAENLFLNLQLNPFLVRFLPSTLILYSSIILLPIYHAMLSMFPSEICYQAQKSMMIGLEFSLNINWIIFTK